jgi:hypothetical protein
VTLLVLHGRSGGRWFWATIAACDPGQPWHACDDPVCIHGGLHRYGWEDRETEALAAMRAAVIELGGPRNAGPGAYGYFASTAREALRRINAAKRAADVPRLRQAMIDSHPDKGGSSAAFTAARGKYERAIKRQPARRRG